MQTYVLYIIKVILISAIMYGYYLVALRNKRFHRYNRFYLLSAAFIPLILPFVRFDMIFVSGNESMPVFVRRDILMDTIVINAKQRLWSTENVLLLIYGLVAGVLIALFIASLVRIYYLKRIGQRYRQEGCLIIESRAKGTPFSFFNYIFWNPEININSADGARILRHELTHVRQYHSLDKLIVNLVQIVCWFNVFLWLIKREINVVHEFLADEASVESGDINAFSRMALQSAYPGFTWPANNSLLYSPIKRRIAMLLKNKKQKVSYFGRLMVLPLAGFIFMFFSVKAKDLTHPTPAIEGNSGDVISTPSTDNAATSKTKVADLQSTVKVPDGRNAGSAGAGEVNNLAAAAVDLLRDTIPNDDRIFTKVEQPAEFPGGPAAWHKYVTQRIQATLGKFTEKDYGTCIVKFIVAKDGTVSNVEAATMQGTELARVSVEAISTGLKWVPAKQNGRIVTSIRLQPVTLTNPR